MQDEVGLGVGTEPDNIVDLLNAPDHDVHSRIYSSGIGSGSVPSFALYVYSLYTLHIATRSMTCYLFLLVLVLYSAAPTDVFATSSLHVSQGKPLHDDIMPEVAEELGPGTQCMAASFHAHVLLH